MIVKLLQRQPIRVVSLDAVRDFHHLVHHILRHILFLDLGLEDKIVAHLKERLQDIRWHRVDNSPAGRLFDIPEPGPAGYEWSMSQRTSEQLTDIAALCQETVGAPEDGDAKPVSVSPGHFDVPPLCLFHQRFALRQPSDHHRDDSAPPAQIHPVLLGDLHPLHRGPGHRHDLRQHKAGRDVGRDSLGSQNLDDFNPLHATRYLDHHIRAQGLQLIGVFDHPLRLGKQAGIQLAGNPAEPALRGLVDRHIHLSAPLHDLFISQPGEFFPVEARIGPSQVVYPLIPKLGIALDCFQGKRWVGRAAAEKASGRILGVIQPPELFLQY